MAAVRNGAAYPEQPRCALGRFVRRRRTAETAGMKLMGAVM